MEEAKKSKENSEQQQQLNINFSTFINEKTGSFTENYKLGGVLGIGAFGQVRKVINKKTKQVRAMKIISKTNLSTEEEQQKFLTEIEILKQLDHPHILKLYEFYQDSKNYYIILELCSGGELFNKIIEKGSFSEKEASYVMKQIISAIVYAHNHNIVHRDLKPENILLDITSVGTYNIKIIDWGTSKIINKNQKLTEKFGTPYYIAPEVLKRQYNELCDIWSCGVILYIILSGIPPFNGSNEQEIMKSVESGYYQMNGDSWKNISEEAKDLIKRMLEINPKQRITASKALEHKWFEIMSSKEKLDNDSFKTKLNSLKSFCAENKLQQAALTYIASQFTSKEEKHQLMQTFKALDTNGDGVLSREEIIQGYSKIMSEEDAEQEVNRIMNQVDIDKSGFIDYTEFILATMDKKKAISKERLQESFSLFDQDGDGYITADEIKRVLGGSISSINDNIWLQIVKECDKNGDGQISVQEFSELMTKYIN